MSVAMKLAYKQDIKDPLVTQAPVTLLMQGDNQANVIELTLMDGAAPASLSGYTATVYLQRADGVRVRCPGSVSGNVATVPLQAECYSVPGQYAAIMKLSGPNELRTVLRLAGYVESDGQGVIIDPSGSIPSYEDLERITQELEEALQQAETAISGANAAAQNANEKAAIADTAAGNANTAAGNANAGAGRANEAAASIEGLTVEASDVAYNQPATATVTDVDGHKHIAFELRQGIPGDVPAIAFAVETGEPGTEVQVEQSGTPDAPTVTLTIPRGDPGEGAVSSVDGLMPGSAGDVALDAVRYVVQTLENAQKQQARENIGAGTVLSVDDVQPGEDGNVVLSAVQYAAQTLTTEQQQQARTNIGAQASLVHNYTYDGQDLSQMFTAAELHQKVSSGDFSGIQNGDYWPIMLTGNFKDYATGQTKTLNNAVFKLEANINVYINYGDTPVANHILFCSRDLIPIALQMRSEDRTWYDDAQTNPWLGSALYQTLNASDGVFPLVAATDIGAYMYVGPNGNGMRFLLETKGLDATTVTGWAWGDRGKLFLPIEREVWGQDVWSEHLWGGGAAVQWPVFAGSLKHISKGLGNGGSRFDWWCQSSCAGRADNFACANGGGVPYYRGAATVGTGAPLCFLFV